MLGWNTAITLLVVIYGLFIYWRIGIPLELSGNEPWNAYHAVGAFRIHELYPNPPGLLNNYTPLSFYVVGLASSGFENTVVVGRFLSLASLVVLGIFSFLISTQLGSKREHSLFGALWFAATMFHGYENYAGVDDPHLFGLAIMAAGFFVFLKRRNGRTVYLAFAIYIVGGLVKNSLFAFPLASLGIMFVEGNLRRYRALVFSLLCVGASALALYGLYGEGFVTQVFAARPVRLFRIITSAQRIQWLLIPLMFWAYSLRYAAPATTKPIVAAMIVASVLVWWGTGIAEGVGTNAIFELAFATSVALASARQRRI